MYGIENMAAICGQEYAADESGSLTPQQAFDVSSYIHTKPRPNTIPHSTNTNSTPSGGFAKKIGLLRSKWRGWDSRSAGVG